MKPLIFDYMQPRSEKNISLKYEYDFERNINIVRTEDGIVPFIDMQSNDLDLMTKTKVKQESDDVHFFAELTTKTMVKTEEDDTRNTILN